METVMFKTTLAVAILLALLVMTYVGYRCREWLVCRQ